MKFDFKVILFGLFLLFVTLFPAIFAEANGNMFGQPVIASSAQVSTKVLNQNGLRNYLLIQNTGSVPLLIKLGSAQSALEGISIPVGGNYEPIKAPSNSVWAKTVSGTGTMTIIEGQ